MIFRLTNRIEPAHKTGRVHGIFLYGAYLFIGGLFVLTAGCQPKSKTAPIAPEPSLAAYASEAEAAVATNITINDAATQTPDGKPVLSVAHQQKLDHKKPSLQLELDSKHNIVPDNPDSTVLTESIIPIEFYESAQPLDVDLETPYNDITTKLPALKDPDLADQMISVNFDQAEIGTVLKTISDITGVNFIVDPSVSGTVTVFSPTQIRLGDLYLFLESILDVKGFTAVPAGDHVKIIPRAEAAKHNLRIRIGGDPAQIPQNDTVVTQLIRISYANAHDISNILSVRMPSATDISVDTSTNTIIITGTSANIHHLARLIQQLDVPGAKDVFTVIHLKHASARILGKQITDFMGKKKTQSARSRRPGQSSQIQTNIQIQANQRTNSLIITASRQDTEIIKQLVQRLDIERPVGTDNVHVVYLKNAQAKEVAEALSPAVANIIVAAPGELQPQVHITPEPGTNSLIINATSQDFEVISQIIEKLDIVREQVLVELLIVEISEENLREIGVDWATMDQAVSNSVRFFGNTNFGVRMNAVSGNLDGFSVGAFKDIGGEVKIGSILSALEKVSDVNILSTPHVVTSNHRKAVILVGENVPYVEQSRITETDPSTPTVVKTFTYKDVGVSLNITPHISQGDMIRLEIDSEFTQLIESVAGLSADTPTTAKRQIKTEVSMVDGATIVIGGLIRDDKNTIVKKIPLLGDIPLLGELFKFKRDRMQKTNLLLFITPHVMSSSADMAGVTQKKQAEIAPELEQRLKKKNINDVNTSDSIWR